MDSGPSHIDQPMVRTTEVEPPSAFAKSPREFKGSRAPRDAGSTFPHKGPLSSLLLGRDSRTAGRAFRTPSRTHLWILRGFFADIEAQPAMIGREAIP
jgi:hypothetical protein